MEAPSQRFALQKAVTDFRNDTRNDFPERRQPITAGMLPLREEQIMQRCSTVLENGKKLPKIETGQISFQYGSFWVWGGERRP